MQAAVWHGAREVHVESVAEPNHPQPGNAIVDVVLACICASDVAEYRDGPHVIPTRRPHPLTGRVAPLTLGHEYTGRVVAVAGDVHRIAVGDRVCGDSCIRCGHCFWCLRGEYNICVVGGSVGLHADGAFAQRVEVPEYTLYRVPDTVTDREAAIVEPLAVGLHTLRRARFEAGETVTVFGYGMIGAATAAVAGAIGAGAVLVVEPSARRRLLALEMGATDVVDPSSSDVRAFVRDRTEQRGSDVVVDCTGISAVLSQAVEASRRGGRVVVAGIGHESAALVPDRIVYFEREVIGALGYRFDHPAIIGLLASKRLRTDRLFGETIGLSEIVDAGLERVLAEPDGPLRIPVSPAK
jgi:(R,R)-butanediol dehydrogenase / meso-butanediol dehydrogenase / diacetyl reductase